MAPRNQLGWAMAEVLPEGLGKASNSNAYWRSVLAAVALISFAWLLCKDSMPEKVADSDWYIALATGRSKEVIRPFASRVIHPLCVRHTASLVGIPTDRAFVVVALGALCLFAASLAVASQRSSVDPIVTAAVVFSPSLLRMFRQAYLPDFFHAALLSLLLAGQPSGFFVPAVLSCLLQATRENTFILAAAVVVMALATARFRLAAGFAVGTAGGVVLASMLSASSQPNLHHLPGTLYIAGKLVFNLARNLFGISLWSDTLNYCSPWKVWQLPGWLHCGNIRALGICPADRTMQIATFSAALTLFGAMPAVVVFGISRWGTRPGQALNFWEVVALVYGLASFAAGFCTGASVDRLLAYAWPAFWLSGPVFLARTARSNRRLWVRIFLLHLLIAWTPDIVVYLGLDPALAAWVGIVCGVAGLLAAWVRLCRGEAHRGAPPSVINPVRS
jgi:hypothetical protein